VPKLYDWSPNSGHFTPGKIIDPLPITINGMTHPVSVLICYEDILPSFTNKVVAHAKPELLVNMSNDAWFGDTAEPWEHVALAQLRAVEHRRYLVRSTNSGVSAVVDPVGRVIVHGGTFDAEALDAIVHWQQTSTVYETLGDVPWYLLTVLLLACAFVPRPEKASTALVLPATALLAFALLTSGCSSSSTTTPSTDAGHTDATTMDAGVDVGVPPDVGTVDAGPCPAIVMVDFGGVTCDSCTANLCCSQATTCYGFIEGGVPPCALLANCIAECQSDTDGGVDAGAACQSTCESKYGSGDSAFKAMQACILSTCTNDAGTGPCDE
jgi:hypothetical protein